MENQQLTTYQKTKKNIYKWREENKDIYNKCVKNAMKRAFDKDPQAKLKKNRDYYHFKQECKRLNNILL